MGYFESSQQHAHRFRVSPSQVYRPEFVVRIIRVVRTEDSCFIDRRAIGNLLY